MPTQPCRVNWSASDIALAVATVGREIKHVHLHFTVAPDHLSSRTSHFATTHLIQHRAARAAALVENTPPPCAARHYLTLFSACCGSALRLTFIRARAPSSLADARAQQPRARLLSRREVARPHHVAHRALRRRRAWHRRARQRCRMAAPGCRRDASHAARPRGTRPRARAVGRRRGAHLRRCRAAHARDRRAAGAEPVHRSRPPRISSVAARRIYREHAWRERVRHAFRENPSREARDRPPISAPRMRPHEGHFQPGSGKVSWSRSVDRGLRVSGAATFTGVLRPWRQGRDPSADLWSSVQLRVAREQISVQGSRISRQKPGIDGHEHRFTDGKTFLAHGIFS